MAKYKQGAYYINAKDKDVAIFQVTNINTEKDSIKYKWITKGLSGLDVQEWSNELEPGEQEIPANYVKILRLLYE